MDNTQITLDEQRLARTLGWFSIGLGAAELLMPKVLCRALNVGDHKGLVRLFGLREIAAGVGILTRTRPSWRAGWLWARVAGDMLDLGALFAALRGNSEKGCVAAAIASVAGVTALDILCGAKLTKRAMLTA